MLQVAAALFLLHLISIGCASDITIYSMQVFAIPIVPQYFNWTSDGGRNEYRYEASLLDSPDLPPWIHYTYSKRTHRGYLYGVAPRDQTNFMLQIVALNKRTYETREKVLEVTVLENDSVSKYQVQLKVDNWNVEDMFDRNSTEALFDVFRQNIWRNATDLQVTFLAPAVELGARYPLKPGGEIGTVLRLGSSIPFSNDLLNLEKEIEPTTKKFTSCHFKKVSFDRFFRGFEFDWCYFRLEYNDTQQENSRRNESNLLLDRSEWRWSQPQRSATPTRSYRKELFTSVFVSGLLLVVVVSFLSAALCLQHDGLKRGMPLLMEHRTSGVQMIQYAESTSGRGTHLSISAAQPSCSPSLSDSRSANRSPRALQDHSPYVRPNPPPYVSPYNFRGVKTDI